MKISTTLTIKDIALALNLSTATVSRALQDSYKISEETKKRVKEFAALHNYEPNLFAQSLRSHKSKSIGVMLCSIPNHFFSEVISGIESTAITNNYHVIITQSHESIEREIQNLAFLSKRNVDGFLVSVSTETTNYDHFKEVLANNIPIVFFDRTAELENVHKVSSQNADASYKATKHLIENGYTKIANITSSHQISITKERTNGYLKALEDCNIPLNENYIKYCTHGGMIEEEISKAIDELLQCPEKPDAIITASDRLTLYTLTELKKRNIKIPHELAVVGFTNFQSPELFCPPLTTIKQAAFEMGKISAELLIKEISKKRRSKYFENIILPCELATRESSAPKTFRKKFRKIH